jgi:HEPN domain-containing protein
MKTAVEFLFGKIKKELGFTSIELEKIFEQAKEMEKEQIIDAYDEAKVEGMCLATNSEYKHLQGFEYYNETFKSE